MELSQQMNGYKTEVRLSCNVSANPWTHLGY